MSGGIFGCHILVGSVQLAACGWRAGRLLNILQCIGQAMLPPTKDDLVQTVIVLGCRNPALEFKHLFLSLKVFLVCFLGRLFSLLVFSCLATVV